MKLHFSFVPFFHLIVPFLLVAFANNKSECFAADIQKMKHPFVPTLVEIFVQFLCTNSYSSMLPTKLTYSITKLLVDFFTFFISATLGIVMLLQHVMMYNKLRLIPLNVIKCETFKTSLLYWYLLSWFLCLIINANKYFALIIRDKHLDQYILFVVDYGELIPGFKIFVTPCSLNLTPLMKIVGIEFKKG